jgi:hypothetical protein
MITGGSHWARMHGKNLVSEEYLIEALRAAGYSDTEIEQALARTSTR